MSNNRSIFPSGDKWANKGDDNDKATSLHDTQREAEKAARDYLHTHGGGELTIHGADGIIRQKDSVPPGHDPSDIPG